MSRKQSFTEENVLGLIFDNCPDLISLVDTNGFLVYSNNAHFIRLGRSAESLAGASLFELIHPEDAAEFENVIKNAAQRCAVFEVTARWLKEDGRSARFDSLGKWISPDASRSHYLLLCSREILPTGQKNPENPESPESVPSDVRADATRLLARAEGEKNHVARVIHDDLGQKLTAISLELSLWKTELDSGQSKSVNSIREKIAVLGDLVNGLIQSTRQVTATLRPRVLEEFGLSAALEWHLEKVQKKTGMACSFSADRDRLDMEPFIAAQIFKIAEEIVELRVRAGCRSLQVRAITQDDVVAVVFEDSGQERELTPDICARVRLLGGQIEISDPERSIVIALPTQLGTASFDEAVL